MAFGTSSPEFVVCLVAALKGSSDITLGNIIGSNIANIALILGLASIIRPTRIDPSILKTQVPFMIIITVVAYILCLGGWLGRVEGLVLFLILWWFSRKPRPIMAVSGLFLIFYGVFRVAIEFVRLPDVHLNEAQDGYLAFGWLTMGQVLSAPMILAGAILFALAYRRNQFVERAAE